MANYNVLEQSIVDNIKENHEEYITGQRLQDILKLMVNILGKVGFQFLGIAESDTNPGTPDYNGFYIATPGTYPNFNATIIEECHIGVFMYNGNGWQCISIETGFRFEYNQSPDGGLTEFMFEQDGWDEPKVMSIMADVSNLGNPKDVAISAWWAARAQIRLDDIQGFTIEIDNITSSPQVIRPIETGKLIDRLNVDALIFDTINGEQITVHANDLPYTVPETFVRVHSTSTLTNVVIHVRGQIDAPGQINLNTEDLNFNSLNQIQFANRVYNSGTPDGMGYVILRKDKTFAEQVSNKPNTIFEIRYNFVLSANCVMPSNSMLKFNGGKISGGYTLTGTNTTIDSALVQIFGTDITLAGSWNVKNSFPEWWGAIGDALTDDYISVQKSLDFCSPYLSRIYNLNGNKLVPKDDGTTIFTFSESGALKNGEIDADVSFSIQSGNNYIFQDVDFVGNPAGNPGTTLQFVRHDVNAEWFGINREEIEHNAERLERLLNCYNVSVRFDSNAYYFNRPIEAKAFRIEMHGTSQRGTSRSKLILVQSTYYNEYEETNVFLKLNTYETVIEGISFQAILVNISDIEYTYFNGIELVDDINKGQVDTYITNCGFEGFDRAIIAHGRGIDVENCWFTRCNFGLRYIPAVEQAHQDPNQNPPYDGRAIRFINNRLHWMYVFVGYGQIRGAVAVYLDALQNETRYVHGIQIINNLCDVYCGLLYSLVGIIKGNIIGNSCNNWRQYQMFFKEDVIDTIIANNNLSYRIATDISADYNAEDSRCNNCIYFEGSINGLIITGNTGKVFKQNFVRFNNIAAIINNVVISGNIISNEDDYRGVLGLDSALVTHLKCINNTINISNEKKIWDAFLPYSENTVFEDVEVDAYTATRFQGKYKVNLIGYPHVGTTAQRPVIPSFIHDVHRQNSIKGFEYQDTTLGMMIYATVMMYNRIVWVDANGQTPGKHRGELADLPNFLSGTAGEGDDGYQFTFTDDATYGNRIVWWNTNAGNGGAWVDANGTVVITNP